MTTAQAFLEELLSRPVGSLTLNEFLYLKRLIFDRGRLLPSVTVGAALSGEAKAEAERCRV